MENEIAGRRTEKRILAELLESGKPELLALYGRRRVGKTYLINRFFEGKGRYFEVCGSKDTPDEVHLARFDSELSHRFYSGKEQFHHENWDQCFDALRAAIDESRTAAPRQPVIVFFDELPWLDGGRGRFMASLDYYWNRHFSRPPYANVLFIVCGSAASWIIRRIISSKGGLHNRVTRIIRLMPFTLGETEEFLQARDVQLERRQIVELYMALGGIPFYLSMVVRGMSSAQTIDSLCFAKDGFLVDEFERLFGSLFDNHELHVRLIRALASVKKGIDRGMLLKNADVASGGEASRALKELEESGFVMRIPNYGMKSRNMIYRLIDQYSLFYLKWIEPVRAQVRLSNGRAYWQTKVNTPSWNAWTGYAFEGICLIHIQAIKTALGIAGVATLESTWRSFAARDTGDEGAQIDLVIDRADRTVNLCEIKFSTGKLRLTGAYHELLRKRRELFRQATGTKSHLVQTLVSTYGTLKPPAGPSAIDNEILLEDLFV